MNPGKTQQALLSHLGVLSALPSVKATESTLDASQAATLRALAEENGKSSGIGREAAEIKAGSKIVFVRPDAPKTLLELNAAQADCIYRPHSGYGDGRLMSLEVYARDFERYGSPDLAEGLTFENLKTKLAIFTRRTVSLRASCYAAGKKGYVQNGVAEMACAVVKLTTNKDGAIAIPNPGDRTTGNVYGIVLDAIEPSRDAVTARLIAKAAEKEQKAAERKAAQEQKAAEKAAQATESAEKPKKAKKAKKETPTA
jgi:hypothetical protein